MKCRYNTPVNYKTFDEATRPINIQNLTEFGCDLRPFMANETD